MLTSLTVGALAALLSPVHSAVMRRGTDLSVQLNAVGNSQVEAVVTNKGSNDVNVFTGGNFLDADPVQKMSVFKSDSPAPFEGVRRNYALTELSRDQFVLVSAGESVKSTVELAEVFDLSEGGEYVISAKGFMSFANSEKTGLQGGALYESNELTLDVDGAEASKVPKAIKALDKRTRVSAECTGSKRQGLLTALDNAVGIAQAASQAALQDDALFEEFFGTLDQAARQDVAARFSAISQESSTTTSGASQYLCNDRYGYCSEGVLAYTLPAQNVIVNCPLYYSYLSPLAQGCGQQGQAMATIHEMTHAPGIYAPGTADHGYGYDACISLTSSQALDSAGCYGLFTVNNRLNC